MVLLGQDFIPCEAVAVCHGGSVVCIYPPFLLCSIASPFQASCISVKIFHKFQTSVLSYCRTTGHHVAAHDCSDFVRGAKTRCIKLDFSGRHAALGENAPSPTCCVKKRSNSEAKQGDFHAPDQRNIGLSERATDSSDGDSLVKRNWRGDSAYPTSKNPSAQYYNIYVTFGAARKKYQSKDGTGFQNCGLWVATQPNQGVCRLLHPVPSILTVLPLAFVTSPLLRVEAG